jgi:hypothetical protein
MTAPARRSIRRRLLPLITGVVLAVGMHWAAPSTSPGKFTPFAPHTLPQSAEGDFDGDGRSDLALIQDSDAGSKVSVRLSGSFDVTSLGTGVAGLVVADVDHDGDLDLVAVAPSGQVIVWLNDGRGRFTSQPVSHASTLSAEAVLGNAPRDGLIAVGVTAPLVAPPPLGGVIVGVTRSARRLDPGVCDLNVRTLQRLRAPPRSSRA